MVSSKNIPWALRHFYTILVFARKKGSSNLLKPFIYNGAEDETRTRTVHTTRPSSRSNSFNQSK
jgi:hypothetical protein